MKEIYTINGGKPGPAIMLLGGTHGDEAIGIAVIRKLLNGFNFNAKNIAHHSGINGTLYLGLGNPAAIDIQKRSASNGRDLNRSFMPSELKNIAKPDERADLKRARELFPLLKKIDILIDIHSTSSASDAFICLSAIPKKHKEIIQYFDIKQIICDPDALVMKEYGLNEMGTIDTALNNRKAIGFAYETGYEHDLNKIDSVLEEMVNVLFTINIFSEDLAKTFVKPVKLKSNLQNQEFYKLVDSVQASEDSFIYADNMQKNWIPVKAGDILGTYKSGQDEIIKFDGMLVFPKHPSKIKKEGNLYFIAQLI